MQIVFLIWPVLLLPVLLAWLTRPKQNAERLNKPRSTKSTSVSTVKTAPAQQVASHSPVQPKEAPPVSLEMLELAIAQRRRESPAYRLAAQTAYQEMQQMADEPEEPSPLRPPLPASHKAHTQHSFRIAHRHPLARLGGTRKPSLRLPRKEAALS